MGEFQKRIDKEWHEGADEEKVIYAEEVTAWIDEAKKEFPNTKRFKEGFVVDETTLDFYRKYVSSVFGWFEKWFGGEE